MTSVKFRGNIYVYEKGEGLRISPNGRIFGPDGHFDNMRDCISHMSKVNSYQLSQVYDEVEKVTLSPELKLKCKAKFNPYSKISKD